MPINVSVDYTEEDGRAAVREEIRKRVAGRVNLFSHEIELAIKETTLAAIRSEVASLDIAGRVRAQIESVLDQTINDAVRRQIRDIVRLAVRQEMAAARAEFDTEPKTEVAP